MPKSPFVFIAVKNLIKHLPPRTGRSLPTVTHELSLGEREHPVLALLPALDADTGESHLRKKASRDVTTSTFQFGAAVTFSDVALNRDSINVSESLGPPAPSMSA